mgnify:FL=1
MIFGYNGTGKTTLVKAIASVAGDHRLLKSGQDHAEIDLTLSDGRMLHQNLFEPGRVQCVVLDEPGEQRLDLTHYKMLLRYLQVRYLRDLDAQLILTIGRMDDELHEWIICFFRATDFTNL